MTPAWLLGICKPLGTITVMFGVACRLAVAGAGEPVRETVPTGEVAQWRLAVTLHAPVATTATLNLTAVGDRVTAAWCLEPVAKPAGKAPHTLLLDPAGLKASVRGLTGTMTGQLCVDDNTYTAMRPITLTVETSDDGSLKGHLSGTLRMLDGTVGHDRPIRGVITGGQRRSADELQRHNQLPPALSWPCWMGPNQNFSATPTATAVVSDIRAARLVWRSETLGPPEMGSYRYGLCAGRRPAAGGASPIVAGGRVFVFVVVPTGEVHSRTHIDKCLADPRFANQVKRLEAMGLDDKSLAHTWAIDADEQVLALDAATGQTLWKTTWPRAGLHMHDHKCGLTNHTGYATADQVFVFGSLGVVRCLSATDGAVLWETAVPGYHQTQVALKARSLAEGHANVPTRSYAHALNAAVPEGVLLAPTAPGDSGLVGLSMRDGRLLWRVERKILGAKVTPMVWRGSGATLALAVITDPATGEGTLTAVDVSSGQVAWTLADLGGNEYHPPWPAMC